MTLAERFAKGLFRRGPVRSIFVYATASIVRSRRHSTILATYFGLGVATALFGVLWAGARRVGDGGLRAHAVWGTWIPPLDEPTGYLLAVPLVFMFFAVIGLRAASKVPTDADAGWAFQIPQPRIDFVDMGMQWFLFVFGVVPVVIATAVAALILWQTEIALRVILFGLLAGIFLTECALFGWAQIPFCSDRVATLDSVRHRWVIYLIALNLFAFRLAEVQAEATRSILGGLMFAAVSTGMIAIMRFVRRRRMPRQLEATESTPSGTVLGLSGSSLHIFRSGGPG